MDLSLAVTGAALRVILTARRANDEGTKMLLYGLIGVSTLVIMLAMDSAWIGLVALPSYRALFGDGLQFRAGPAILFYLLYLVGVLFFVVRPALQAGGWTTSLAYGALFGLVAYGTYDLTNYSTLRVWTPGLTASDMIWGAVLTAVAPTLGIIAGTYLLSVIKPG
jgi:uncharacterized membrane protein